MPQWSVQARSYSSVPAPHIPLMLKRSFETKSEMELEPRILHRALCNALLTETPIQSHPTSGGATPCPEKKKFWPKCQISIDDNMNEIFTNVEEKVAFFDKITRVTSTKSHLFIFLAGADFRVQLQVCCCKAASGPHQVQKRGLGNAVNTARSRVQHLFTVTIRLSGFHFATSEHRNQPPSLVTLESQLPILRMLETSASMLEIRAQE